MALFIAQGEERPQDDAAQPTSETDPVLLAADAHGAIVYRNGVLTGVARDKGVVWEREVDQLPMAVTCTPTCPRAILSGTDSGPLSEDPAPILVHGARLPVPAWAEPTGGKNEILAAGADGALRIITDEEGAAWWEMTRPDGAVEREPAVGANALWFPASDGSAAVAMVLRTQDQRYVQQALVSRADGWHVASDAVANDAGGSGCIAPQGRRWLLDGVALRSSTAVHPLQVEGQFGNCAFTSRSLVLSGNSVSEAGKRTQLVGVDGSGEQVWRTEIEAETFVAANSARDEFVTMGDGSRRVIVYGGAGEELTRLKGLTFALFDEVGDLVAVDPEGQVVWFERG